MKIEFRNIRSWAILIINLIPIFFFAAMMWRVRWIGDDGLINTRIVNNILEGYGPVFNIGERVEAFTSPLWIFILSILGALGIRPDSGSVFAGFFLSIFGMIFAIVASSRFWPRIVRETPRLLLPLGMIVYSALPPAWDYGTSGLENGLSLAWLGGAFCYLSSLGIGNDRSEGRRSSLRIYGYTVVLGLGPLVRPELSIFSIGMLIPLVFELLSVKGRSNDSFIRRTLSIAGLGIVMSILPVGYQIFRMGYFAALTSNTAIAKEAFLSNWEQGEHYFDNFFKLYYLAGPLILLVVFLLASFFHSSSKRVVAALAAPCICGILYCLFVVKVGGDFMHGRLFLPGLFGVLLPVSAVDPNVIGRSAAARILAAVCIAVVLAWALYCSSSLRMTIGNQFYIGDERGWYTRRSRTPNPVSVNDYKPFSFYKDAASLRSRLKKACPSKAPCRRLILLDIQKRTRLKDGGEGNPLNERMVDRREQMVAVRGAIGIFGTAAGSSIRIVDRFGIVDPIASRLSLKQRGRPGHEKNLSDSWVTARFADTSSVIDKKVQAAKAALHCPPLDALIRAVNEPLTPGRFWSNIKNASRFQALRIPPDPMEAKKMFCK